MPSEVTVDDDELHVPESEDLYWTETHWFAFAVPERKLTGSIYPVVRANQNICSAGVYIWDDTGEAAHDIKYFHNYWHQPMPKSFRSLSLPCGLSYECLEPLRHWRVRYDDERDCVIDLSYEALYTYTPRAWSGHEGPHHFDQPCHVTGTIRLYGETIEVDGLEMRDKSWAPRSDGRSVFSKPGRACYSYGLASPSSGFLTVSTGAGGTEQVMGGFLMRDGVRADLVSGTHRSQRERGRPTSIVIEATDAMGRTLEASGQCVNRFAKQATPGVLVWLSGTEWDLDGERAWGEDQDMTSPRQRREEFHNS